MKPALRDLRLLALALAVIALTWLALGQFLVDRAIAQADGSVFVAPYTQSALAGGFDWTHHLYRFGVLGGSAMHDFAGTLPLVQLCAALGLSTALTMNVVAIAVQLGFAYFGVTLIESRVPLTTAHRVIAIWLCAFAPLVGWRIAWGHDNLLWGCLPFVAAIAGWSAARAGRLSAVTLVMIALACWHGVSTLGAQTLIYSAMFGAPLALAVAWPRRAEAQRRFSRDHALVLAALAAGLLVALPRFAGMLAYATGDDTARTLDAHLTYSFGTAGWRDWLGSIPWTTRVAGSLSGDVGVHEHQFPLGPMMLVLLATWPRSLPRRWLVGLGAGTLLAILFAGDVWPISNALLAIVKPLGAFRVPARAVMPLFVLVPPLALAAVWSSRRVASPTTPDSNSATNATAPDSTTAPSSATTRTNERARWLALAVGFVVIALVRDALPWPREILAWVACAVVVIVVRAPTWLARVPRLLEHRDLVRDLALVLVAVLGVCAFTERFPRGLPNDPIDGPPAALHDAVLAQAPELASPLVRIEIVDPPMPYAMSTAFAARLGSLDGDYNPTRRFLDLVSAASGRRLPPTAVVFQLAHDRSFPLLQQLYNVHYVLARDTLEPLPPTPGAAWFPEQIATGDSETFVRALHAEPDLRAALLHTAWLANSEDAARVPAGCRDATVHDVAPDSLGQSATIGVTAPTDCLLVVSTNYVSFLRAHATLRGESRELAVVPVDIALTGIVVPAGAARVVLEPVATIPLWTRIASIAGLLLLAATVFATLRRA